MTPDELRALADALEPMAKAPRFEDMDVPAFCRWLRACADAQPVAWRCEVRGDGSNPAWDGFGWRHYHTTTSEREALAFVARCGNGIEGRAVPLYPHHAPAAPQAEPCIGNDSACPCQDGDACHYKDAADGTKAWPVPQAEPKREPLHELPPLPNKEKLHTVLPDDYRYGHIYGYTADQMREYARAVERAAYERAAKECENRSGPIEIYNRAYPHYLECAAAIRALGRQHG